MKKILIIDSHKGTQHGIPQNLHWQNAKITQNHLIEKGNEVDLIWSYPTVNDTIKCDYDAIVFTHASHYAFTDYKWLEQSPNAKLYYITNEYNLGEPRTLWMAAKKTDRKYTVIANHESKISKVVRKYTSDWLITNLNVLIYNPNENSLYNMKDKCIYYGSFRKDRSDYFKKYLNDKILLSTHSKNISKFKEAGAASEIVKRIDWSKEGLNNFEFSLYIEDVRNHDNYNHLANRFYEALNYYVTPLFAKECLNTINLSGYNIDNDYIIDSSDEILDKKGLLNNPLWYTKAKEEKQAVLQYLTEIITN